MKLEQCLGLKKFRVIKDDKMKSCLILGSGRSGTSMVAGILSKSGYYMGENLYPKDEGNPKGYFENAYINGINEEILAQITPRRPPGIIGDLFFRSRPKYWQQWVSVVPTDTKIRCPEDVKRRIQEMVAHSPFCFKDPRFSYTLPAWRPYLDEETVFIVVFRDPLTTVTSMVKEANRSHPDLRIDAFRALVVWECMYTHILKNHYPEGGNWQFYHYEQFLEGDNALKRLKTNLGVTVVDSEFPEARFYRSKPLNTPIPLTTQTREIYTQLCGLAGYKDNENSS